MRISIFMLISVAVFAATLSVLAAEPEPAKVDSAAIDFFEKKIRPVLVDSCYECHSEQAKADEIGRASCRERV